MNNDIRNLTKWLNEDQEAPLDRQALARVLTMAEQPAQQEPVAWRWKMSLIPDAWQLSDQPHPEAALKEALYTSPQPAQRKPLTDEQIAEIAAQALRAANAIMFDVIGERKWDVPCTAQHVLTYAKKYTAPKSKPWVGLTFEEVREIFQKMFDVHADWPDFADAIEAKLKEKNT